MSSSQANARSATSFASIQRAGPPAPAVFVVRRTAGTPGFLRRRRYRSLINSCKNSKNSRSAGSRKIAPVKSPLAGRVDRASISSAIAPCRSRLWARLDRYAAVNPGLPKANSRSSLAQIKGPLREPSIEKIAGAPAGWDLASQSAD